MPGPRVQFSQSLAAGATFDPMATSIYRYLPFPAYLLVCAWTTAVGVTVQALSGSELIQPTCPVEFGAPAAGRMPTFFNVQPLEFSAPPGDLLQIIFTNTTGGALTVSGFIDITPA